MENFLINMLLVSVITGILTIVLKIISPYFNNKYTSFLKQLVWIVLAIRLIVPLNYNNTFFTVDSKLYQDEDIITYSVSRISEKDNAASTYVAPYNKGSLPKKYSGKDKINGYDTTKDILSETVLDENEKNVDNNNFINSIYNIRFYVNQIMYVYIAGVIIFLIYHLVCYALLLINIRKKAELIESGQICDVLKAVSDKRGLRRVPEVFYMEKINSPMAVGFFRFRILLPKEEYTDRELNAIFSHEITHILHNDLRIKWIYLLANALHWFNPLIYLMVREASLDMEFYCDFSVVETESTDARMEYNELLISILKNHKRSDRQSLLTTQFKGGVKEMKKRFLANLDMRKKKQGIIPTIILICVIIVSAGLFSMNISEVAASNENDSFWDVHQFKESMYQNLAVNDYNDTDEENSYIVKAGDASLPAQPEINEAGNWEVPMLYNDGAGNVYVDYYEFDKAGTIKDPYGAVVANNKRKSLSEVPEISIYCGDEKIQNYGVKLNHWDVNSREFVSTDDSDIPDSDNFFVKQAVLDNPLVKVSNWFEISDYIYMYFKEGEEPDLINVQDTVLTDDGHVRYPGYGFATIYRNVYPIDGLAKIDVCEHYSIEQCEDWMTYEDLYHPYNRGYCVNCYWDTTDGMQSCTYYIVIRTQSEKYERLIQNEK